MSGAPKAASRSANSFSTSTRWVASQANACAPVLFTSAARSPVLRAASATLIPSVASRRAKEAERPEPAPTIRAVLNLASSNFDWAMADLPRILAKMPAGYHVRTGETDRHDALRGRGRVRGARGRPVVADAEQARLRPAARRRRGRTQARRKILFSVRHTAAVEHAAQRPHLADVVAWAVSPRGQAVTPPRAPPLRRPAAAPGRRRRNIR